MQIYEKLNLKWKFKFDKKISPKKIISKQLKKESQKI